MLLVCKVIAHVLNYFPVIAQAAHMSEKDINILSQKLSGSLTFWESQPEAAIGDVLEKHI